MISRRPLFYFLMLVAGAAGFAAASVFALSIRRSILLHRALATFSVSWTSSSLSRKLISLDSIS
jgi:hypothetical protein